MWKGKDQTTIYLNFSQIHRGPKNGQTVTRPFMSFYEGQLKQLISHMLLNPLKMVVQFFQTASNLPILMIQMLFPKFNRPFMAPTSER